MHPLLEHLHVVKNKLFKSERSGLCLDLFPSTNDTQIYSSSKFSKVLCLAATSQDSKYMIETSPSRPLLRVVSWDITSYDGILMLDSWIVFSSFSGDVSCMWMYLYKCTFSDEQFEKLIQVLYNRCSDNSNLFIVCVDNRLACQHAKSQIVYIDKFDQMHMQYDKVSVANVSLESIREICGKNGFIEESSINGAEILNSLGINCLPYDLWTSETFLLLRFKSKFHFRKLMS